MKDKKQNRRINSNCGGCINSEELEKVIIAALEKIDRNRAAQAKADSENDRLAESTKTVLQVVFGTIALLCFVSTLMFGFSFFPENQFRELESLYSLSSAGKAIGIIISAIYTFVSANLIRSVSKETDRNYMVSYFSALTSIIALIVALVK